MAKSTTRKAIKDLVYLPVPMDTFRNFFCLDLIKTRNETPLLSDDMTALDIAALLCDFFALTGMQEDALASQLDSANTSILVSTNGGAIFIAASYLMNGIKHHILATAQLSLVPNEDGEACYTPLTESFLAGHEIPHEGGMAFETDFAFIKIADGNDAKYDYPSDVAEFYAALNYMRFAMMSCVGRDSMDTQLNQVLLTSASINTAQERFIDYLGYTDIDAALKAYKVERASFTEFVKLGQQQIGGDTPHRHLC